MKTLGLGLAVIVTAAAPALAQTDEGGEALQLCRTIGKDSERLRCYDAALDDIYGVDSELEEKRAQYRRDRFGLPVDDNGLQLTELEAVVTEVDENLRTGLIYIALDNGQIWELLSSGGLRARIKSGMTVIINESGTGGYRLRIPDKTGFKGVNRVR